MSKKTKKILGLATLIGGVTFVGLSMVAKKKKADSIYDHESE